MVDARRQCSSNKTTNEPSDNMRNSQHATTHPLPYTLMKAGLWQGRRIGSHTRKTDTIDIMAL